MLTPTFFMEKESINNNPDLSHTRTTPLPALIEDGKHQVLVNKNDAGTLLVRVAEGEQTIFTAAVSSGKDLCLTLTDGRQVLFPIMKKESEISTKEAPVIKQQEILTPPPITIEGYPVRAGKYTLDETTGERQYKLIVAHHPNPKDRKQVIYYELTADGEKAEDCFRAGVTDTRIPVHVTGDDLTRTITKKNGTERLVHQIRIDTLEKIRERRPDNPEILREKVPLQLPR